MAAYASLTPDQKSMLLAFSLVARGSMIKLAQVLNLLQDLDTAYQTVSPILALVDNGETIPDGNALAGSQTVTAFDLKTWLPAIEAILATNNTAGWRSAYIKAGGVANTMQSA